MRYQVGCKVRSLVHDDRRRVVLQGFVDTGYGPQWVVHVGISAIILLWYFLELTFP